MTVYVLAVVPARPVNSVEPIRTLPLTGEWKRPCPEPGCGEHEVGHVQIGDDYDGDSPITTVLTCQTCDGEGKDVGVFGQSFSPSCPDCVDGKPIIEWDGQRLALEAVPIYVDDNPVPKGVNAWVFIHDDDDRQGPWLHRIVGTETVSIPITLPDDAKGYAIVGTEQP